MKRRKYSFMHPCILSSFYLLSLPSFARNNSVLMSNYIEQCWPLCVERNIFVWSSFSVNKLPKNGQVNSNCHCWSHYSVLIIMASMHNLLLICTSLNKQHFFFFAKTCIINSLSLTQAEFFTPNWLISFEILPQFRFLCN